MPSASNSSFIQPTPTPSATRPREIADAVATDLATLKTFRIGSTNTLVAKRIRTVAAAIAPIATQTSGQSVNGSQRRLPSCVYGYLVAIARG